MKAEEFLRAVFEEERNGGDETQSEQAAIDLSGNGFHEQELSEHGFLFAAALTGLSRQGEF